jgi:hypothetical protein
MNASIFETAVRDYLTGLRDWDSVHQLALDMEVEGVDFPAEVRRPMEELHLIFLTADSRDDPQFRADRAEISELLMEVDRLKNDARDLGSNVVAECQDILNREQEENRRLEYLENRNRRRKRS